MHNTAMAQICSTLGDAVWGARGCFFTFHRSAPAAIWPTLPNRNFYLDADFLDTMLGYLARTGWSVVTTADALDRLSRPGLSRIVNFSVDDCYRDTAEIVVPIFRKHGMPVTLYVTTGIPDGTMPLWGAGLETILAERDSVTHHGVAQATATAGQKRQAYAEIAASWDGHDPGAQYAAFCVANGYDEAGLHARHAITWPMLEALRDDPHVELGAHTISHPRLSDLPAAAAEREIAGSGARLRERLGVPCTAFAFPYGRRGDCGAREFDIARRAGFTSAATTRKGLVRPGQRAHALPRNTLNGKHRSTAAAEAHLLGLSGVAARALGRV